ncbi:PAP2 superfamily-domain-containing protein [Spinellus fusiger]|nr:PAP2 superfamily-domain-containing protein [Spinellus fusiger]
MDAGTLNSRVYEKAFHPARAKLRQVLVPLIHQETPYLASLQHSSRTPFWDAYFLWTANLGTHTFFMIFLPLLIWFANAELGRNIACLTAAGVFWSGFFKDLLCLPRPLSPPLHRLTMSTGVALEYGFPSTHTTNSVSVGLYMAAAACEQFLPDSTARLVCLVSCGVYVVSVVFGRLYCGMHSLTDVIGGGLLAYLLYWIQWTFRFEFNMLFTQDSYWVLLAIPLCISLVSLHPDPVERCPCFEDSVCFMGVLMGLLPGSWLCQQSATCVLGLSSATTYQLNLTVILVVLTKTVLGVAVLFLWRIVIKKASYQVLPPIYRALNLPHRKFEMGAKYYKDLNKESIDPIPSVLDLKGLATSIEESDRVGQELSIESERRKTELKYRHQKSPQEEVPMRYDVDIVTKLIVYAGIGFLAVYPLPFVFQLLFPHSSG